MSPFVNDIMNQRLWEMLKERQCDFIFTAQFILQSSLMCFTGYTNKHSVNNTVQSNRKSETLVLITSICIHDPLGAPQSQPEEGFDVPSKLFWRSAKKGATLMTVDTVVCQLLTVSSVQFNSIFIVIPCGEILYYIIYIFYNNRAKNWKQAYMTHYRVHHLFVHPKVLKQLKW